MKTWKKVGLAAIPLLLSWGLFVTIWPVSEGQKVDPDDMALPLDLSGTSLPDIPNDAVLHTYRVSEGSHLYFPVRSIFPTWFKYSFHGAVEFDSSAYIQPVEWSYEKEEGGVALDWDYFDWNKLYGVTGWLSRPNRSSAMIAFRPSIDRKYCHELAGYTNDRDGGWLSTEQEKDSDGNKKVVTVCAGERAQFYGTYKNGTITYIIENDNGDVISSVHRWDKPWISSAINTWFGGENNSPGPFGGVPNRDLSVKIYARIY